MKNSSILRLSLAVSLIIALAASPAVAQLETGSASAILGKWKLSQFDFGLAISSDNYKNMSYEQLMQLAKDQRPLQQNLDGLEEEAITRTTGASIYLNLGFTPINQKSGKLKDNQELRLGMAFHSPKESMVSFKNKELDTSIVYCNLHTEVTLEAAYLWKWKFGKNDRWRTYIGAGMNASASLSNQMQLIMGQYFEPGAHPSEQVSFEDNRSIYEARSLAYTRVYVPYGIHYKVSDKWTIGIDSKRGVGMQKIIGGKTNYINRTHMTSLGAKLILP